MFDGILFDLDGTLWDSTPEVTIAFNKVMDEKYHELGYKVTQERLRSEFGLPLDVIAVHLFVSIDEEYAKAIMRDCCEYECEYLARNGATLYEGLEQQLAVLSSKYKLAIVSNCQDGYIQAFFQAYPELEKYFIDYEYPGRTGKLKADNIRLVVERNNMLKPVYVGDTNADAKAAAEAGVPFIFARYGFGDVKEYFDVIDSLPELGSKLAWNKLQDK